MKNLPIYRRIKKYSEKRNFLKQQLGGGLPWGTPTYVLRCVSCSRTYDEQQTVTNCLICHSALDIIYLKVNKKLPAHLPQNSFDFLKNAGLLPLNGQRFISLKEGNTPLIEPEVLRKQFSLPHLYLKFEGANPTGVFKDRGSAVEISKALELKAKAVTCASTGNMAASVAAYCAEAQLPCYVVIPEKTPLGKLAQAIAYGARVIKVRGDYGDCVRLSVEMAKQYHFYLAGDYVFRSEGQKALAYELYHQLYSNEASRPFQKCSVPDWVIVPVGCGTNLSAIFKGFKELKELGLIDRIPRFIGVQPENVPTIVEAWKRKQKHYVPVEHAFTVASAVGIGTPLDDVKVLQALYESNGYAQTASEEEILQSQQLLGTAQSLFVEPSAALVVAVLPHLLKKKIIKPQDIVVAVLTGNGLKDPQSILASAVNSPVLEPTMKELKRYFSLGMEKPQRISLSQDKEKKLWTSLPNKAKLKTDLKKLFDISITENSLQHMYEILESFKHKEKMIRKGDVEYALEAILKIPEGMKRILEVKDFSVHATQHQTAEAWVALLFDGQEVAGRSKGVGPVDAIINAIHESLKNKDTIGAKLTYYNVKINTSGTDAVVEVNLSLQSHSGQEVTGEAVSPDVIVASIKAFENAYNLLNWKVAQSNASMKPSLGPSSSEQGGSQWSRSGMRRRNEGHFQEGKLP